MEHGYVSLVLHAHLPFISRPAETEDSLGERWLWEAITESYLPLLLVFETLVEDGVDFRLTISISPTLAVMLNDPFLQRRYLRALDGLIDLADKEKNRTKSDPAVYPLARMYRNRFARVRAAFVNRYGGNVLNGFRRFEQLGKLDLITTAATHAYFPLLSVSESSIRAQIRIGVEHHERLFGSKPKGFWLPECGYYPGLDALLREQDIRFTILETHGITRADNRPRYGVYAPIYSPAGLAAFGRDPDSSRQVWSALEGYPGDFDYREFYRDIGHELDLDYIQPYILRDGTRIDTGIKYFRITGKDNHKQPYVPAWAERKANVHAEHFLAERRKQFERLAALMDRTPITVAPYDAELFGHWWFEGPQWLNYLLRKIARDDKVRLVTLPEYLDEFPTNQTAEPSMSSWGYKGFSEAWLNQKNHWIYPHLHAAAELMEKMATTQANPSSLASRALNQAARELMLAQASDWTFMISTGAMEDYAVARSKSHLLRFHQLRQQIETNSIREEQLRELERTDNLFAEVDLVHAFGIPAVEPPIEVAAIPQPAEQIDERAWVADRRLHIVMICPEAVPFAKTGGLADMVGSLAVALEQLGQRLSIIMPAHRSVLRSGFGLEDTGSRIAVTIAQRTEQAEVLRSKVGRSIAVYFIRADRYFNRDQLYGTADGDYSDNAERFAFFARAALEVLGTIDAADIVHAHDWQAALAIALLKASPERYPGLASVRTVFTVHNLGYQGLFPPHDWHVLDLDFEFFSPKGFEFYGKINFLKSGLVFADAVTTVSPTYAREIRTAEFGFGLEGVFQERAASVVGIMNGADYNVWNPATDTLIAKHYTPDDLSGKRACKADLQAAFGLPQDPDVPLFGAVSRLASQKGFDLLQTAFDDLLQRDLQFVLVGTGEKQYQDYFITAASRHPGKAAVRIAYEELLAHKIEAGADMFLMPSRYEPSGLTQLYSLKYGTIPIVRATGGLKDTIEEFDPASGTGNGFLFESYEPSALLAAIDRALAAFQNKQQWRMLMMNGMTADHSWRRSAGEYLDLYRRLVAGRFR